MMFDDDFFDELEKEFERMRKMFKKILEEEFMHFPREMKRPTLEGGKRYPGKVYGFYMRVGPDGKPVIREFGNTGRRVFEKETIEPLTDIFHEKDGVRIIAEMPGIDEKNINIKLKEGKIIIEGKGEKRHYYKEIRIEKELDEKKMERRYKNGILEIFIPYKSP